MKKDSITISLPDDKVSKETLLKLDLILQSKGHLIKRLLVQTVSQLSMKLGKFTSPGLTVSSQLMKLEFIPSSLACSSSMLEHKQESLEKNYHG